MSRDLERAFGDLADAAARAAEHGILAAPALEPTLHRLTTSVRRRRAARTAAVGALALVLVAATAGAVNAGLLHRGAPVPPAQTTTAPAPTPGPTTTSPTEPTTTPTSAPAALVLPSGLACGDAEDLLLQLGDPQVTRPVLAVTASYLPDTAVDAVLRASVSVGPLGAETLDLTGAAVTLVLVRDGVIVGGGAFDQGSAGSTPTSGTGEFRMTDAPRACPGGAPLTGGEYAAWVVVTATPPGAAQPVLNAGGPWALTLTEPGVTAEPVAQYFRCGEPLPFTAQTRPLDGLTLAADMPETWGPGTQWSATVGTSGGDTILANVGLVPRIVFVDPAGLVAGFAWGSSGAVELLEAGPTTTATLEGPTYVLACGPDGGTTDADDTGLAPGPYDAWPFATAVPKEVQHADGTAEVPPASPVLVVGEPHRVTFPG